MSRSFRFLSCPQIVFESSILHRIGAVLPIKNKTILLITGDKSLAASGNLDKLLGSLKMSGCKLFQLKISGEPSPDYVDDAVSSMRGEPIDMVIAVGGGSVLDAGKAVSAMLPNEGSVVDYIEGMGNRRLSGKKIAFAAVPTTSGTGSEATNNAVLSRVGKDGFKKSLRHNSLVPDYAIIDPSLMKTCPSEITASCGMDAFTQLLESYISVNSNPLTDSLTFSGLLAIRENLILACTAGAEILEVRTGMAFAALLSGMCIANAGVGIVHGISGIIGGMFDIPHGVLCGTLVAECTRMNIQKLLDEKGTDNETVQKYAEIGKAFSSYEEENNTERCCDLLIETLEDWVETLNMPPLSNFGLKESDIEEISKAVQNKSNPIELRPNEISDILLSRL